MESTLQRMVKYSLVCLVASILVPLPAIAQQAARLDQCDIKQICDPLIRINGGSKSVKKSHDYSLKMLSEMCESKSMTKEEASSSGFDLEAVIYGVPVKLMYDQDSKTRTEARSKLCTLDFTAVKSKGYSDVLIKDGVPNLPQDYNVCVAAVAGVSSFSVQ